MCQVLYFFPVVEVALVTGVLLLAILPQVFFLLNIQKTLKEVGIERRTISPQNVWLILIPVFSLIYRFVFYLKVSRSLAAEYKHRGLNSLGSHGKFLGIILSIVIFCQFTLYVTTGLSDPGSIVLWWLFFFPRLICFAWYWDKMSRYKLHLSTNPEKL